MNEAIYKELRALQPDHDPRHIAAWILTGGESIRMMSKRQLKKESQVAAACIRQAGKRASEAVAESWGL